MRRVLAFCRLGVLELEQSFGKVAGHGQMDLSSRVVPVKGDANVFVPFPDCFDVVVSPDGVNEVLRVFFANIFDTEIINDKRELYRALFVFPETWDEGL